MRCKIFHVARISLQRERMGSTLWLEPIYFASSLNVATARLPRAATAVHRCARFFDYCIANISRPTSPNHDANRKTSSASPANAARLDSARSGDVHNGTEPRLNLSSPSPFSSPRHAPSLLSRAENTIVSTICSAMLVAHSSVSPVNMHREISEPVIFKVIQTRKEMDRSAR